MDISKIEFDGDGDAEDDLARLWTQAPVGKRERIAIAVNDAEDRPRENPEAGSLITDGVHPPVRYLDCDILRVFYQVYDPVLVGPQGKWVPSLTLRVGVIGARLATGRAGSHHFFAARAAANAASCFSVCVSA